MCCLFSRLGNTGTIREYKKHKNQLFLDSPNLNYGNISRYTVVYLVYGIIPKQVYRVYIKLYYPSNNTGICVDYLTVSTATSAC